MSTLLLHFCDLLWVGGYPQTRHPVGNLQPHRRRVGLDGSWLSLTNNLVKESHGLDVDALLVRKKINGLAME